jgi:ABC-type amino acid transport substrate-binding protein
MLFRANDELRGEFNTTLDALKEEGVISDLYTEWFNETPEADSPMVTAVPAITTDTCAD